MESLERPASAAPWPAGWRWPRRASHRNPPRAPPGRRAGVSGPDLCCRWNWAGGWRRKTWPGATSSPSEQDYGIALGYAELSIDAVAASAELARPAGSGRRRAADSSGADDLHPRRPPLELDWIHYRGDRFRYRLRVEQEGGAEVSVAHKPGAAALAQRAQTVRASSKVTPPRQGFMSRAYSCVTGLSACFTVASSSTSAHSSIKR